MKKRILALLCAVVMCLSVFTVSSSAAGVDTDDTYWKYQWNTGGNNSRYDYTPARQKGNETPVYLRTENGTLPYGGFYAQTFYGYNNAVVGMVASLKEYLVNDYLAHTIQANATSNIQSNNWVRIRGHYKNTTYSWGDCTIWWSPDTDYSTPERLYPLN